jgi:Chaperone of endosialidase
MKPLARFKTTTPPLLIALLLVCFGLAPMAQAVGPDTDGTIPGSNNGEGTGVLVSRTGGIWNTGTGFEALNHLTSGNQNTATGLRALFSDINGGFNTATGVLSLFSNTGGFFNSATGAYSLANNTIGNYNTANGYGSLYYNIEGLANTANGYAALYRNTTGGVNTADGAFALFSNTTGDDNTAIGGSALESNTTGAFNTANGVGALGNNITGGANVAIGSQALESNITGFQNTAVGAAALFNNTAGTANIALGVNAGIGVTTVDNVICIGADGENVSNSCYIGNIFNATSSGGTAVFINSNGRLGTATSSRRFKEEVKRMEGASEALYALKPVTFRYKKGIDPQGIPQFGLVAEEVEVVNPDLVVRDKEGKVNTVRYEAVNAMLLNEFLKEHRKVEEQQALIAELKSTVAQQQKSFQSKLAEQETQIEALASGLRKVTAQVEMSQPAQKVVTSKQ